MFCAIIRVEEISLKSVRSGRLLKRDRADFIFYSRKPTTSPPAAEKQVELIKNAMVIIVVPPVFLGEHPSNILVFIAG